MSPQIFYIFLRHEFPHGTLGIFALFHISKAHPMPNFIIIYLFICFHLLCFLMVLIFVFSILFASVLVVAFVWTRMWNCEKSNETTRKNKQMMLILAYTNGSDATFLPLDQSAVEICACVWSLFICATTNYSCQCVWFLFYFFKVRILVETTIKTKRNACMWVIVSVLVWCHQVECTSQKNTNNEKNKQQQQQWIK